MCNSKRVGTLISSVLVQENSIKDGEVKQPSVGLLALQ